MLTGYQISRHLLEDRLDRVLAISEIFGFGEIVYRFSGENQYGDKIEAVTNTGILVVLDKDEKLIITMYPINFKKLQSLFNGKAPDELKRTVSKNMKRKEWGLF